MQWCKERPTSLSTANLGWSVKTRSMQYNEFGNKWVGSDSSCCNPCTVVNESMSVPSGDVMPSGHHDLDLALKLPNTIVKNDWSCLTKFWSFSQNLIRTHQIQLLLDLEIDK